MAVLECGDAIYTTWSVLKRMGLALAPVRVQSLNLVFLRDKKKPG
jgi:hypothetical protein